MADDLVKRGVSLDEARRQILDTLAESSDQTRTFGHVSVPLGGQNERVTRREAAANALLHRYSPTLFQLTDAARQFRGMTLMELARESLARISQGRGCIGPKNLRKFFCNEELSGSRTGSDANTLYLRTARI